jgi:two-component system, NarL family, sensor kinase
MAVEAVGRRVSSAWRELGRIGRVAFVGVAFSAVIAIGLGITIPQILESHLLDERANSLLGVVDDLAGQVVLSGPDSDFSALEAFVGLRVIGGDTVRTKLWSPEGEIVWSDEPRLIGRSFQLGDDARRAFAGEVNSHLTSLDSPENEFERHFGNLLEFYVPVRVHDDVPYVFEVYQLSDPLTTTVARARRTVWLAISLGLATMGVFMVGVAAAVVASADRRQRQAERLLDRLAAVRDEERSRLATAMHDDMGQPLYRLLYGLESLSVDARDERSGAEIARLRAIVRDIDGTVRGELRRLQDPPLANKDLAAAFADLADPGSEDSPAVEVDIQSIDRSSPRAEEVLYRTVREAIANARRHSDATSIRLSVSRVDDRLTAEIADDGHGRRGSPGLGSAVVATMLAGVEGGIETISREAVGTTVIVWVPVVRNR